MTKTKTLEDGTTCILVHVEDEENEVRCHWHHDPGNPLEGLYGLLVKSASLGVICDVGDWGECE